ncbi:MAG: SH3 domain-containing protein [Treponema sp.]|jgi:hypothetical protein|nr:SH3 domain-containing protein [Treponema sp.]
MRLGKNHGFSGSAPLLFFLLAAACFASVSCSRQGWGVLLWSTEEPSIPSGTVLPVYIHSNIDKVWVVGIPDAYRSGKGALNKMEIPLSHFELAGNRAKARKQAAEFAQYALVYAENMQDGLPVRESPDNSARRVYRLRTGELIKVLSLAQGNPAISASGEPLPGDWYKVLTKDGVAGYCFSYRLKLFEHSGGILTAAPSTQEEAADPDLDMLMSKVWSPESYSVMLNNRRINLEDFSRHWRFDPGQDTGIAHIYLPNLDRSFPYTAIRPDGERAWRFEGTSLQMQFRSDTSLAVQFVESSGGMRTLLFVALPAGVDDIIMQETARREGLYSAIYTQGPVFSSNNYGTIVFGEGGSFSWSGFDLLVPQIIPSTAAGSGTVSMDLFLASALADRYNGAFSLRFAGSAEPAAARFMYTLDNQGFRIEVVPDSNIEDVTVMRRSASPMVLYFFRDEGPELLLSDW